MKYIGLFTIGLLTLSAVLGQQEERPQTPKPPFNYSIEEVEYENADHSVHYGATLTIPANKKSFPTVIIISGSGTQDRDGTILGHKLYWVLADYLTNNGIAVLRVDDRGAGKSTIGPNPKELTSVDFSYDVEASLNFLLNRKDINTKNIGLIGHSEGGIIAPMVAARRKEISFLVLWGAPAIGGAATNTNQNLFQLRKAGIDSTATVAFGKLHNQMLAKFTAPDKEQLNKQLDTVYSNWLKQQTPAVIKSLYATEKTIVGQGVQFMYDGLYDIHWMRYFINYHPVEDLKKITCRVLAINGEKDTQVDANSNLILIESTLKTNGNKKVAIEKLPGLNHLLQTANTGDFSEYQKIKETISPVALELIAKWINKK